MKNLIFLTLIFASFFVKAQDSANVMVHEIGFNTVSLIKQMISNNPSSTLAQLPYTVFYNYCPGKTGLRVGLGGSVSNSQTSIEAQTTPRTTKSGNLNLRIGVMTNIVSHKRVTLNAFADAVVANSKSSTVNTSTTQTFGNPIVTQTFESTQTSTGYGAQAGVGVKYNLYKHLSIYAEVPITFLTQSNKTDDSSAIQGSPAVKSSSKSTVNDLRITLPATLYLVLRF